jgi:hypothetical protein
MEWIELVWNEITIYISVPYLLTFILLSYLVKRYFEIFLTALTRVRWKTVYTVLIIATLTAVPFLLWTEIEWTEIVFSYVLGTSFHELLLGFIEKMFIKKVKK